MEIKEQLIKDNNVLSAKFDTETKSYKEPSLKIFTEINKNSYWKESSYWKDEDYLLSTIYPFVKGDDIETLSTDEKNKLSDIFFDSKEDVLKLFEIAFEKGFFKKGLKKNIKKKYLFYFELNSNKIIYYKKGYVLGESLNDVFEKIKSQRNKIEKYSDLDFISIIGENNTENGEYIFYNEKK